MSEINEQLNNLFDSMSEEEEVELSEELGIERAVEEAYEKLEATEDEIKKINYKGGKHPPQKDLRRLRGVSLGQDVERKRKANKSKQVNEDHIQATADRLGKFISSEDKKVRREIDGYNSLTEEERRDRKIQILENEVSKIAQMTRAHFPGEGGENLVSGIGQGGDGQTPGSGAVWLWDLDDVEIGTPLNGQYPQISNGAVLVYNNSLDKWVVGAGSAGGVIYTADLLLSNEVTNENVDVGDLPPPGTLTTQEGVNQWIAASLLYIDGKISGGSDNDMEFDGDIEFISNQTQSLIKYNGGKLDIKVGETDLASAVIVGEFTTAGLTLPSKTLAAQAVNSTTGAFTGAVTIHTLTTGSENGVAINAAAGQVTAQWMNIGKNPETDDTDADYDVSIRTSGKIITPEENVTTISGARKGVVYKLVAGDGVAFDGQASTHIGGTVGNDYTTNTGTLKVNATVLRTTGDQIIAGNKTYTGSTSDPKSLMTREAVTALSPSGGFKFQGTCDVTLPRDNAANSTVAEDPGNFYINTVAGTAYNSGTAEQNWTGIGGLSIAANQLIIWSEVNSRFFAGSVEGSSVYMPKSAGSDNPFVGDVFIGESTDETELITTAFGSIIAKQLANESSSGKLITKAADNTTGFVAYAAGSTEQIGAMTIKGTNANKSIRVRGASGNKLRLQVSDNLDSDETITYVDAIETTTAKTDLNLDTEAKDGFKVSGAKATISAGMTIQDNPISSSNVVFEIEGKVYSGTDGTGTISNGNVLSVTHHSDGSAGTITYAGAQNYSNGIMNRAGITALIGDKSVATTGGTIATSGGGSNTEGNLYIRALNGETTSGRLYIQQQVSGQSGDSNETTITLNPSGNIQMGNTLTLGSSTLLADKTIKTVVNSGGNLAFTLGFSTQSADQVTILNLKHNSVHSARLAYVNGRFAVGDGSGGHSVTQAAITIDGVDTTGGKAGDIRYPACTETKSLYVEGTNSLRAFAIRTGTSASAGSVIFRPNESGSNMNGVNYPSANYMGTQIRMYAASTDNEAQTPKIELDPAVDNGTITARNYNMSGTGNFVTPSGFKLINGTSQNEMIVVDGAQNMTLNIQTGPEIIGTRLTINTSEKNAGTNADFYIVGQEDANYLRFLFGENVGGGNGSVPVMTLERDTTKGTNSQKIATFDAGIVMTGVGATTNNSATRTENAITFNNGTSNGTAMIHKIGNTGGENLVHISGRNNDGTGLNGIYSVVRIGRDADNKMQGDFMWTSTTTGKAPDQYTIWNQNVAKSFGAVTATNTTYDESDNLTAATIPGDVEFSGTLTAPTPTADGHLATKAYVDSHSDVTNAAQTDEHNTFTNKQTIQTTSGSGLQITNCDSTTDNGFGALSFKFSSNSTNGGNARIAHILFQGAGNNNGTTPGQYIFGRDTATNNVSATDKFFTLQAPYGNAGTVKTTFNSAIEVPTPTADAHAATKEYVDNHSSNISGGQQSGTFTATFDGTGTTPGTKQTATGHYRKIGHITHIHLTATSVDLTGYAGGAIRIKGLPFQPDTSVGEQIGHIHGVNFMVNNYHADDGHIAVVDHDATYGSHIKVFCEQVDQETVYIPNSTGAKVRITITYIATS